VKGSRSREARCRRYAHGPIIAAQEDRNRIEPAVHLGSNVSHLPTFHDSDSNLQNDQLAWSPEGNNREKEEAEEEA
jgi:hypothetical protein